MAVYAITVQGAPSTTSVSAPRSAPDRRAPTCTSRGRGGARSGRRAPRRPRRRGPDDEPRTPIHGDVIVPVPRTARAARFRPRSSRTAPYAGGRGESGSLGSREEDLEGVAAGEQARRRREERPTAERAMTACVRELGHVECDREDQHAAEPCEPGGDGARPSRGARRQPVTTAPSSDARRRGEMAGAEPIRDESDDAAYMPAAAPAKHEASWSPARIAAEPARSSASQASRPVSVRGSVSAGASSAGGEQRQCDGRDGDRRSARRPARGRAGVRGASSESTYAAGERAYTSAISCSRASRSRRARTQKSIDSAAHVTARPGPGQQVRGRDGRERRARRRRGRGRVPAGAGGAAPPTRPPRPRLRRPASMPRSRPSAVEKRREAEREPDAARTKASRAGRARSRPRRAAARCRWRAAGARATRRPLSVPASAERSARQPSQAAWAATTAAIAIRSRCQLRGTRNVRPFAASTITANAADTHSRSAVESPAARAPTPTRAGRCRRRSRSPRPSAITTATAAMQAREGKREPVGNEVVARGRGGEARVAARDPCSDRADGRQHLAVAPAHPEAGADGESPRRRPRTRRASPA